MASLFRSEAKIFEEVENRWWHNLLLVDILDECVIHTGEVNSAGTPFIWTRCKHVSSLGEVGSALVTRVGCTIVVVHTNDTANRCTLGVSVCAIHHGLGEINWCSSGTGCSLASTNTSSFDLFGMLTESNQMAVNFTQEITECLDLAHWCSTRGGCLAGLGLFDFMIEQSFECDLVWDVVVSGVLRLWRVLRTIKDVESHWCNAPLIVGCESRSKDSISGHSAGHLTNEALDNITFTRDTPCWDIHVGWIIQGSAWSPVLSVPRE